MRRPGARAAGALIVLAAASCAGPRGAGVEAPRAGRPAIVDAFEDAAAWSAHPADGVELALGTDGGAVGNALRLDFRDIISNAREVERPFGANHFEARYCFSEW